MAVCVAAALHGALSLDDLPCASPLLLSQLNSSTSAARISEINFGVSGFTGAPSSSSLRLPSLASLRSSSGAAASLARALPRCARGWAHEELELAAAARRRGDRELGTSTAVAESAGLSAALRATARAQTKVVSTVSAAVVEKLKTRFLMLVILFIKNVVIPDYLCPPITDGMMMYMGPVIAYQIISPLVQGIIEAGQPQIPNLLGSVIGVFLAVILTMKLVVMLTTTLGDGIVYVLTNALNRAVSRGVIAFVNTHLLTSELFLILTETSERVTANVVNRLGLSLTHSLTHSVTHKVTHRILHHYYCIYCYYYGNFCDFCHYYNEMTYMHRLWGFGQGGSAECGSPRDVPAAIDALGARTGAS